MSNRHQRFSEAVRAAIVAADYRDVSMLLFMLCGIGARFAISAGMPLEAFILAARNAYDCQQRDFEVWASKHTPKA